jgi:hypothetical protein
MRPLLATLLLAACATPQKVECACSCLTRDQSAMTLQGPLFYGPGGDRITLEAPWIGRLTMPAADGGAVLLPYSGLVAQ